jgi:hypothetical protein
MTNSLENAIDNAKGYRDYQDYINYNIVRLVWSKQFILDDDDNKNLLFKINSVSKMFKKDTNKILWTVNSLIERGQLSQKNFTIIDNRYYVNIKAIKQIFLSRYLYKIKQINGEPAEGNEDRYEEEQKQKEATNDS